MMRMCQSNCCSKSQRTILYFYFSNGSGGDGDVRAAAPDLVGLLTVPPPSEYILTRRSRGRNDNYIHDL
jgi:hypothetical protein